MGGLPTDRIIVKYRDPSQVALARAGYPLDGARVAKIMAAAGSPVAWMRGCARRRQRACGMLARLPIARSRKHGRAHRRGSRSRLCGSRLRPDAAARADRSLLRVGERVPPAAAAISGTCSIPSAASTCRRAWDITTGSASIRVAVLDTGALPGHPDLAGRFVGGYDMIADCAVGNDNQPATCTWSSQTPAMTSRDSRRLGPGRLGHLARSPPASAAPRLRTTGSRAVSPSGSSWHGTHVAGTIGAIPNNGIGIAGINWVSPIVPVRVLGKCGGYDSDIDAAIVWAAGGSVAGLPSNAEPRPRDQPEPRRRRQLHRGNAKCGKRGAGPRRGGRGVGRQLERQRRQLQPGELQRRHHRRGDHHRRLARALQQLRDFGRNRRARRQRFAPASSTSCPR